MANTTDFICTVYDELVRVLSITDADRSVIFQMAWPGFSLAPSDFKRSESPSDPYDPDVAKEAFSQVANIAPVFNMTRYENSGCEVDDLYEILISSAIPSGATLETLENNPTYKLFSDAQYEFLNARRGVHDDPNAFYYPCTATPSNWYDEAAAPFWPTLNIKPTEVRPTTPTSSFVKAGGLVLANQGVWKLRPTSNNANAIKMHIQNAIIGRTQPVTLTQPGIPVTLTTKPLTKHAVAALRSAVPIDSVITRTPMFVDDLRAERKRTLFTKKNIPVTVYTKFNLGTQIQSIDLTQKKPNLGSLGITNRFVLQDQINQKLPTKPPSTTDGFSISFKFCRVNIDRPWFKLALLSTRNWYMFGTNVGGYSTGTTQNNPGMFPLLPTSFIAIRDLKITANWSQEDSQNLGEAVAFGLFDIRDSTLISNTLEVRGLQIIGWISRLMPELPPMSPP